MLKRAFRPGFVGRDGHLVGILDRVQELNQLLSIVKSALPPELAPLCMGAAWSGSELQIAVTSGAAAARLRMCGPAILATLRGANVHATAIRPRVQVTLQREKPKQTNQLSLPSSAMDAFSGLAQTLENGELRDAVEALLRHHQKR